MASLFDGTVTEFPTQSEDVASLLSEAGLRASSTDLVSPGRSTAIADGDVVVVRHAIPVTLHFGDERVVGLRPSLCCGWVDGRDGGEQSGDERASPVACTHPQPPLSSASHRIAARSSLGARVRRRPSVYSQPTAR